MIVLDTTACIDYLNGNENIWNLISKIEGLFYITSITIYEINIGLERTKIKISEKRYNELNKRWLEFISGIEVLPLNIKEALEAARIYNRLESKGKIIDDNDILIMGIMLSNGFRKIITRNVKHFKLIKEIEVLTY
ncbi:MAG: type II toxin-antitoxin system VapC family toxin [Promethearchaeota archaeon]